MKKLTFIYFLIIVSTLISCSVSEKDKSNETNTSSEIDNTVVLPKKEMEISKISLDTIGRMKISKTLTVNGKLDIPPHSVVSIVAPMGGFVKLSEVVQGTKIRKGQLMASLEHQNYIQLQQDYIDASLQLEFLKQEYERELDLSKHKINAPRDLQSISTKYKTIQNTVNGLSLKLSLIGINALDLKEGGIQRLINVYSPIDGYVTKVNVNMGKNVMPEEVMFEIVDTKHLHAELTVFEKDISAIRQGQKINFRTVSNNQVHKATVFVISKTIADDRSVNVHAHMEEHSIDLLPGMFITANIELSDIDANVLPEEAFVRYDNRDFIFVVLDKNKENNRFQMVEVFKGKSIEGKMSFEFAKEVEPIKNNEVVVKGAFDLLSKLKNTEE